MLGARVRLLGIRWGVETVTRELLHPEIRSFVASDGTELSYTLWTPSPDPQGSVARIIAILPGVGFHSAPYEVVASSLNMSGTVFAGLDFRGHGHSDGKPGRLGSPKRMTQDVTEWIDRLRSWVPTADVFLLGESMGGLYALRTALQVSQDLRGLILIAPAVIPSWPQIWNLDSLRSLGSLILSPSTPSIDLSGWRLSIGSRDTDFISLRRSDTLALMTVSPTYILRISQGILSTMLKASLVVECPVFIAHGSRDNVLSPIGSRLLNLRLRCPEKRLRILPDAFHPLFWDPCRRLLFAELADWVVTHSSH